MASAKLASLRRLDEIWWIFELAFAGIFGVDC